MDKIFHCIQILIFAYDWDVTVEQPNMNFFFSHVEHAVYSSVKLQRISYNWCLVNLRDALTQPSVTNYLVCESMF